MNIHKVIITMAYKSYDLDKIKYLKRIQFYLHENRKTCSNHLKFSVIDLKGDIYIINI